MIKNCLLIVLVLLIAFSVTAQNVGIGTATPQKELHVIGDIRTDGKRLFFSSLQNLYGNGGATFYLNANNANVTQLKFRDSDDVNYFGFYGAYDGDYFGIRDANDNFVLRSQLDTYLSLSTGGTEHMRILDNGSLGIGTLTPAQKLHVNGNVRSDLRNFYFGGVQRLYGDGASSFQFYSNHSTSTQLILRDLEGTIYGRLNGSSDGAYFGLMDKDSKYFLLNAYNDYIAFKFNNLEKMRLTVAGNLGVGTGNPTEKLEVVGKIKATGLQVTTGATAGDVLISDATGNATWQPASSINDGDWTEGTGVVYNTTSKVGIGTTTPLAPLNVKYNGGAGIVIQKTNDYPSLQFLENSGDKWDLADNANRFDFRFTPSGGTTSTTLTIRETGNVGIGNAVPQEKLHVNGNVRSETGNYFFGGIQKLYGDKASSLQFYGNHSTVSQFLMRDLEGSIYGRLIGSGNGQYFGLMDKDAKYFLLNDYNNNISFRLSDTERMRLTNDGNLGIGTTVPTQKLHVQGNIRVNSGSVYLGAVQRLLGDASTALYWDSNHSTSSQMIYRDKENEVYGRVIGQSNGTVFGLMDNETKWMIKRTSSANITGLYAGNNTAPKMSILDNGNIGIGTTNPTDKLSVNGKVRSKEIVVELVNWPDYVFKPEYKMPTLQQEEEYIKLKGHLSGFESEAEMGDNLTLGEVTIRQQEKIEQIMLHLIEMDKKMEALTKENEQLKKRLEDK